MTKNNIKLTNSQKFQLVIEGIKGRPVAEICSAYGICQAHYYRLRDHFLQKGEQVFLVDKTNVKEAKLSLENRKLKQCVAELTLELKKNEDW